jgi:hypothetical protein
MHEAFDLNIRPLVAVLKAFNEPGRSLQFVTEGSAGANGMAPITWLDPLRAECFVAPWGWPCHQGNTGRLVWWDSARRLT